MVTVQTAPVKAYPGDRFFVQILQGFSESLLALSFEPYFMTIPGIKKQKCSLSLYAIIYFRDR